VPREGVSVVTEKFARDSEHEGFVPAGGEDFVWSDPELVA
jgi:hypothetical protein